MEAEQREEEQQQATDTIYTEPNNTPAPIVLDENGNKISQEEEDKDTSSSSNFLESFPNIEQSKSPSPEKKKKGFVLYPNKTEDDEDDSFDEVEENGRDDKKVVVVRGKEEEIQQPSQQRYRIEMEYWKKNRRKGTYKIFESRTVSYLSTTKENLRVFNIKQCDMLCTIQDEGKRYLNFIDQEHEKLLNQLKVQNKTEEKEY